MSEETIAKTLDASGLACPMPVVNTRKAIGTLEIGEVLEVISTDPGSMPDMDAWARQTQHELLNSENRGTTFRFLLRKTH